MIFDSSGTSAMGRVSEGDVGERVFKRGRIRDFFHDEGKEDEEKERLISLTSTGRDSEEMSRSILFVILSWPRALDVKCSMELWTCSGVTGVKEKGGNVRFGGSGAFIAFVKSDGVKGGCRFTV